MTFLLFILGVAMIYSTVHLFFLQKKAYADRTEYEKVVTWVAIISISLVFIGLIAGN
jgi:uncharacterized membrane protein YiaA